MSLVLVAAEKNTKNAVGKRKLKELKELKELKKLRELKKYLSVANPLLC